MANTMRNTAGLVMTMMTVIVAGAVLTACGNGATETEFVEACLKEGQSANSQLLDKELGVTREGFCKCGATVAKSSLSSEAYRAMVLEMQGKPRKPRPSPRR